MTNADKYRKIIHLLANRNLCDSDLDQLPDEYFEGLINWFESSYGSLDE